MNIKSVITIRHLSQNCSIFTDLALFAVVLKMARIWVAFFVLLSQRMVGIVLNFHQRIN